MSRKRKLLKLLMEDDDELAAIAVALKCDETIYRSSCLYRKRWDSEYLVNLAQQEGSFVAEYRVSPREFDMLNTLLSDNLKVNDKMAALATQSLPGMKPRLLIVGVLFFCKNILYFEF